MKIRSIKVHGGKFYLCKFIISNFPAEYQNLTYCEPYAGGGSILLNKQPSQKEIYNDIDKNLAFIFYCLKHHPTYIQKRLSEIDYCEDSFNWAINYPKISINHPDDDLEVSVREIVIRRMSRGGLKTHFSWSDRLRGGEFGDLHAWKTWQKQIPIISERLQNVSILWQPAQQIIEALDDNALIYCDPPYLPSTRSVSKTYDAEMTEKDHVDLADLLCKMKSKVILSGYYSQLYQKLYKNWRLSIKEIANHASQAKTKERRLECLWMNY